MPTKLNNHLSYYMWGLVALLLSIGELFRLPVSGMFAPNIRDLIVAIAFIFVGVKTVKAPILPEFRTYSKWVLLLFFIMTTSLVLRIGSVPTTPLLLAALYPLRWIVYALTPAVLSKITNVRQIPAIISLVIFMFVCMAVLGILQFFLFPDLKVLETIGYDPHYYRLVSTWLDPNFIGIALIFGSLFTYSQNHIPNKYKATSIVILTLAILLTFSRSVYLCFFIAGILYSMLTLSWRTAVATLAVSCIAFAILAFPRATLEQNKRIDRNMSASLRLVSYYQSYIIVKQNPISGVGYNLLRYERNKLHYFYDLRQGGNSGGGIDSSWLTVLATTGLIGLAAYISFWIRIIYLIVEKSKKVPTKLFQSFQQSFSRATNQQKMLLTITITWAINAWFINSLLYPLLILLWSSIFTLVILEKKTTD